MRGFDQQSQYGPALLSSTLPTVAQMADQEVAAAEHIQGHGAVAVVVVMEEALPLVPVHRGVCGVEVKNQALGRPLVAGNELVKEHFVEARCH